MLFEFWCGVSLIYVDRFLLLENIVGLVIEVRIVLVSRGLIFGIFIKWWFVLFLWVLVMICWLLLRICFLIIFSWLVSMVRFLCVCVGRWLLLGLVIIVRRWLRLIWLIGVVILNLVRCVCRVLVNCVCWWVRIFFIWCSIIIVCCLGVFMLIKCMVGWVIVL